MNYKDYNKNTKKTMKQVENYLIEKYGEIKPQWELSLSLMADNLELLQECKDSVKLNGIYSPVRAAKNPLISTIKDINATLLKIAQQLGITPWAESKIKSIDEDNTDNFIDGLINE